MNWAVWGKYRNTQEMPWKSSQGLPVLLQAHHSANCSFGGVIWGSQERMNLWGLVQGHPQGTSHMDFKHRVLHNGPENLSQLNWGQLWEISEQEALGLSPALPFLRFSKKLHLSNRLHLLYCTKHAELGSNIQAVKFQKKARVLAFQKLSDNVQKLISTQVTVAVPDAGKLDLQKNPKPMLNDILPKTQIKSVQITLWCCIFCCAHPQVNQSWTY